MAKINLLPWREELFKRRQKDFFNALVLSVLMGIILFGLLHTYIAGLEAYQGQRNQMLLNEISELDKKPSVESHRILLLEIL